MRGNFRNAAFAAAGCLFAATAAATGIQSPLHPAGLQAQRIYNLFWFFFWVCAAVYVVTMAFLIAALFRRRNEVVEEDAPAERRMGVAVAIGTAITALILLVFLGSSASTGKAISHLDPKGALMINVVGHQWWWEITYEDSNPSRSVTTANELHIPVGRPVLVRMTSRDVIHSFWIPNLQGKRDLIPSHTTSTWIRADRQGVYRGQCAEYCGMQHANMALMVVAEAPDQYDAWLAQQRNPSVPPLDPSARRGSDIFMSLPCAMCHTVRGSAASGMNGPDLTHVAGRMTLAAGTLPNNRGNMAGWISNPQTIKPGNHMPNVLLRAEDLQPLTDYLESLK